MQITTLDGQNCFDTVDVKQSRDQLQAALPDVQVIVPRSHFSCNGRVTGYLISLESANNSSGGYPSVQVWHPTSSTAYTRVNTECALTGNNISMMRDGPGHVYYLGNVSCTGNNRIEFQSGDVIGYHQGSAQLWSIESNEYTSYYHNTSSPLNTFTTNNASQSNRQPLIQVIYGKINTLTHVKELSMPYFWVTA